MPITALRLTPSRRSPISLAGTPFDHKLRSVLTAFSVHTIAIDFILLRFILRCFAAGRTNYLSEHPSRSQNLAKKDFHLNPATGATYAALLWT
ncbi:uncharacterized protein METZ01_LOCUS471044, partial [marine metagenome]